MEDQNLMIDAEVMKDFIRENVIDKFEYQTLISETPLQFTDLNSLGLFGWELVTSLPVAMPPKVSKLELTPGPRQPSFVIVSYFKRKIY